MGKRIKTWIRKNVITKIKAKVRSTKEWKDKFLSKLSLQKDGRMAKRPRKKGKNCRR